MELISNDEDYTNVDEEKCAKKGGNAQKRIGIYLDRNLHPDLLIAPNADHMSEEVLSQHAPSLRETEKEYIHMARIGQGRFRSDLLEAYSRACPITGIQNPSLLIASHIKPWKTCTNLERLDPKNGILFAVMIDRLRCLC